MIYWILFGACFILQAISTPLFLKLSWPNRSIKSLTAKMVSATLFVLVGFLSVKITGNTSAFANTMMLGLILGWIGDYFLHSDGHVFFGIGFTSFMAGHIVYIKGYITALSSFEGYSNINMVEIVALIILISIAMWMFKRFDLKFSTKFLKLAVVVYSMILVMMFVKATSLGVNFMLSGGKNGVLALLVLMFGSLLFVLSDATIGILIFGGQKNNRPLKIFNIATYFAGQMLLASSILFINI